MNQNFSTFDLELATVLITLNYKLLKLDKTNPNKVRFVFEEKKGIGQTMINYWNNKINLPAQKLLNNQKKLRKRI